MPTIKYDVYVNNNLEGVAMSLNHAIIFAQALFNAYVQEPNLAVTIKRREVGEVVAPTVDDFNALFNALVEESE